MIPVTRHEWVEALHDARTHLSKGTELSPEAVTRLARIVLAAEERLTYDRNTALDTLGLVEQVSPLGLRALIAKCRDRLSAVGLIVNRE